MNLPTGNDPSKRLAKAAAFVVAWGDSDVQRQEAILQGFLREDPAMGGALLLGYVSHLFVDHLKSEHGDQWPAVLMQAAHDARRVL